jgi:hypothetical protein
MKRTSWGRACIRRSGEYGARRSSQLEDVLVALTGVLLAGEEPSREAKAATPAIVGAPEGTDDEFYEELEKMSLPALREVAETADFEELKTALTALRRFADLAAIWHQMQEAVGSTPLGAGLADIDLRTRDPAWQAVDALAVAAALRATPALLDLLASIEEVTRQALR